MHKYLAISVSYKFDLENLLEFIEYHRLVGVQKIYLCNNDDNPTATNRILKPYTDEGFVLNLHTAKRFHNSNNRQASAHNYVLGFARRDQFKWLAMLDMDEFLYPVEGNSIIQLLANYEDCPSLQVNYACFGSSGYKCKQLLQTDSYIWRANDTWKWNHLTKAIAQVDIIRNCDHHHYFNLLKANKFDEDKKKCKWVKPPKMKHIRINHYLTRSREDYKIKMKRGNPIGEKRDWSWFEWADRNEVFDNGMQKFVPKLTEVLQNNRNWYNSKRLMKVL